MLITLGILFLTLVAGGPLVSGRSTAPEQTGTIQHNQLGPAATSKLYLPLISVPPSVILCNGKVYDGFTERLFVLKTSQDKNPNLRKVIRNCIFRNSTKRPITINDAQNVIIDGNTFENIRTNQPGVDVHAIDILCMDPCNINNVIINNNTFNNIGADGIQLGEGSRNIRNVIIQNNIFQGNEATGENGIDIKGVAGPIYILGNSLHGFRPCESPTSNPPGNQDCSGSGGQAMIIHAGDRSGSPSNIVLEGNRFYDSVSGLVIIENARNIVIRDNDIFDNLSVGLHINRASNVTIEGNRFSNNPENMIVKNCTNCIVK